LEEPVSWDVLGQLLDLFDVFSIANLTIYVPLHVVFLTEALATQTTLKVSFLSVRLDVILDQVFLLEDFAAV